MQAVVDLFDLIGGKPLGDERERGARRGELLIRALLVSLGCGAIYGLAAGSADLGIALGNLYKVPMVMLLSTLSSAPVALVTWKLVGARNRASDLLMGVAAGNLTGAMTLAALAPIVALYYHTSASLGGAVAMGATTLGVGIGLFALLRAVVARATPESRGLSLMLPLFVLVSAESASLLQFIHAASPILPEVTVFDGGADALLGG